MYPKAKKKLIKLQGTNGAKDDDVTTPSKNTPAKKLSKFQRTNEAKNDEDTTPSKNTPSKKARRPAKKRKVSEDFDTQDETDIAGSAEDTHAGPETDETEAAEAVAIKNEAVAVKDEAVAIKDETPIGSIEEEV
jgi:hypothetical protein